MIVAALVPFTSGTGNQPSIAGLEIRTHWKPVIRINQSRATVPSAASLQPRLVRSVEPFFPREEEMRKMSCNSSKLRQFVLAALLVAPLFFVLTLAPAVGNAQPSGGCAGVANITIGTTVYTPQWCQEFNGAAGSPDTTVWNFDLGGGGWGNGEAEVYCGPPGYSGNPSQCPTTFSPTTAPTYIDGNGHLVIQAINENGAWLSGRMNTQGMENFTYGILEASIQLPDTTNQGLWPAWWALGSDITTVPWPGCGEEDIMENWSPQVDNGEGTTGDISTAHTTKTGGSGVGGRFTFPAGEATNTAFHTYGLNWAQNSLQTFVDDPTAPFVTITPGSLPAGDTWPFNQDMFVLLNVAVGGTLGGSDANLTSPQVVKVDYVRWYTPSTPVTCSLPPATPTQLTAEASSSSVVGLVWTAVANPPANCTITGYNVYGSTTSGFTPGSNNLIASGLTSNEYTVTGLTDLTTYYYVVEAVDAFGNSAASNQASATTLAPGATSPEIVAIAAGGPAQSNAASGDYSFFADEDFVGGAINGKATTTVNLTQPGVNAAPMGVYQNGRNGTITYTIPGLTAGNPYTVLLHFAENYFSAAGGREFNVAINGTAVLTNLDIYAKVGKNAALVEQFTATANSSGQIVIAFTNGAVNQPVVMGIEVRGAASASCSADPAQPQGLTAAASSSSVVGLSWTAVTPPANCTISGYNVYRSTTSGFTPGTGNLIASGLTSPSYTNTGLAASTTYYYVVEAVDAFGSSAASAQASATTPAPACATNPSAPTGLTAAAASSSAIGLNWSAVTPPANCTISSYSVYGSTTSGFTPGTGNLIASGLTSLSYTNSGLTPSTTYYYVVEALDSFGTSPASNQANATTQPGGSGGDFIAINFEGPAVSNAGGGDASFAADEDFTGGGKATPTTTTISTTSVGVNAAPMAVYQTQRDGTFTYTIPGMVAGSTHTVLLHFAEIYFNAAGDREFNVAINGTSVLTNFDQFAAAGGKDIAVVKTFTTTANSSGQIVIAFTNGAVNQPSVAGLEIR
jgi:beta-glucanase (GH16 family)